MRGMKLDGSLPLREGRGVATFAVQAQACFEVKGRLGGGGIDVARRDGRRRRARTERMRSARARIAGRGGAAGEEVARRSDARGARREIEDRGAMGDRTRPRSG